MLSLLGIVSVLTNKVLVSQMVCIVFVSLAYLLIAVVIFGFMASFLAILSLMTDKEIFMEASIFSLSSFWLLLATTVGLGKILGQLWYKKSGYAITKKIEYLSIGVELLFLFFYTMALVYYSNFLDLLIN
jgi:hypothetical protein